MEDHGNPQKKHSIDEIIEHMTADIQNSDGQYIQLGFTPPSPPGWSGNEHTFLRHPSLLHYEMNLPKTNDMHGFYYAPARQAALSGLPENHDIIRTMVDGSGNIVNVLYSSGSATMLPPHAYNVVPHDGREPIKQSLGTFGGYETKSVEATAAVGHPRDYGLFGTGDVQQAQHYHKAHLIDNLVGNWVPNQSGTYSPFGCADVGLRQTNQQGSQTNLPICESDTEYKARGSARKTRIVAEVRPMRPSYSDVLSKSVPTPASKQCSAPGNIVSNKAEVINTSKTKNSSISKGSVTKKNSKSSSLKRQHSSGSDEHNSSTTIQSKSGSKHPVADVKQSNVGCKFSLPRKWVSLDNLDSDKQIRDDEQAFNSQEGSTQKSSRTASRNTADDVIKKSSGNARSKGSHNDEESWDEFGATLNNHKASGGKGHASLTTKRPPIHINNLGNSAWGEKNAAKGSGTTKNCRGIPEDKKGPGKCGTARSSGEKGGAVGKRRRKRENHSPLGLVCRPIKHHVMCWGHVALQIVVWFLNLLSDVLSMSGRLFLHLCAFLCNWLCMWSLNAWKKLEQLGFGWWNFWQRDKSSKAGDGVDLKDGFQPRLENNISLPATGDEAMRRLLACKGKDPYSILGVTPHCTDDDIKKYYKRQAVLVHPDKNNQPGAEEAFKILVHAFELIGEPERRTSYDRRVAETQQVEQAWSELSDLLSQLHKKMEYAANTIRCTNCGKRHRRIHMDRPSYAARFCAQCKIHHNAREGDIWAESSMFGFLWHYYACMDGGVYDITEWAACQADNLRHLRANTHTVQYRIVLGKQSQQQSHGRHRTSHRSPPDSNSEADLEDFLNNLYNQPGDGGRTDSARSRKKGKRKK